MKIANIYKFIFTTLALLIWPSKPAYSNQDSLLMAMYADTLAYELESVTFVAKSESRTLQEKGFAISAINTTKSARTNLVTSELLGRTSGVRLRQSGGAGSDIQYNINGLSGNSIRIFIDGVPMENYGSSFSVSSLPPSMIDKIEVYKGVVPADLTDDALGGAINIVLKQPTSTTVSASYTHGSFNTHKGDLNVNYRNCKSGFTVQGTAFYNYSDNSYNVWGDAVKITDPMTGKLQKITARRFHDSYQSKGATVNVGFTKTRWADRFLVGLIYSDMFKDIQHGATMDVVYGNRHSNQHTILGKVQYTKKNLVKNLDVSANLSFSRGNRQVTDTIPYMYNWMGEIVVDRNGNPVKWNKGGGEAGKATMATNIENTATGRARMQYHLNSNHSIAANVLYNRFTRDVNDPYLSEVEQLYTETRVIRKLISGVDYNGKFMDDKLKANAFYKHYFQTVHLADPVLVDGMIKPEAISRSLSDHGVGGALSYSLAYNVMVTSSAEYATRLPGINELLGNTSNNVQASYDLRPEKSMNINLGLLLGTFTYADHNFDSELNLFYRDISDMIQKSLTNPTDEMYGYENLGKVLSKGVDMTLKYNYDHKLFSEFNLSYTDARFNLQFDKNGTEYIYYKDRLRNNPFFTFNWNVEYIARDLIQKGSKISFTYNMGYVHQFYRNWSSLGGAGKAVIPTQFVQDLGMTYSFPKNRLSISADIKNLMNEQVFDNWALQKPGRMFLIKASYMLNN